MLCQHNQPKLSLIFRGQWNCHVILVKRVQRVCSCRVSFQRLYFKDPRLRSSTIWTKYAKSIPAAHKIQNVCKKILLWEKVLDKSVGRIQRKEKPWCTLTWVGLFAVLIWHFSEERGASIMKHLNFIGSDREAMLNGNMQFQIWFIVMENPNPFPGAPPLYLFLNRIVDNGDDDDNSTFSCTWLTLIVTPIRIICTTIWRIVNMFIGHAWL